MGQGRCRDPSISRQVFLSPTGCNILFQPMLNPMISISCGIDYEQGQTGPLYLDFAHASCVRPHFHGVDSFSLSSLTALWMPLQLHLDFVT
jgi:hypothetical protein